MSQDARGGSPIDCGGVRYKGDGFCLVEGRRQYGDVRGPDVLRISLVRGMKAAYPAMQVVIGFLTFGLGLWPVWRLWFWLTRGGVFWVPEGAMIVFAGLGLWLVYEALARGWFLRVETLAGVRKLAFDRRARPEEILGFVRRLRDEAGIAVELPPELP